MVRITKDEAQELRRRFRDKCHIYRLDKQCSKKHHYLCSEEPRLIKALEDMRGAKVEIEE